MSLSNDGVDCTVFFSQSDKIRVKRVMVKKKKKPNLCINCDIRFQNAEKIILRHVVV